MISHRRIPYDFISSYSLEECIERLDAKQGKYIDTSLSFRFEQVNSDTCKFHLTINAPSTRNQGPVNKHYDGIIQDQGKSGTLIRIDNSRPGFQVYLRIVAVCAFMIWLFYSVFSTQSQFLRGDTPLLFIALAAAACLLIVGSLRLNSIDDNIINLLEDTLIEKEPPITDSLKQKLNRLLNPKDKRSRR